MNILISLLLLLAAPESDRDSVSGQVFSDETGRSLAMTHISTPENGNGTVTEDDGTFRIELTNDETILKISRLGYESKLVRLTDQHFSGLQEFYLKPATSRMNEVIIRATRTAGDDIRADGDHHASTTEEFIEGLAGVGMIKRANYGWEPSIRGMSAGRMEVLIDDVKMTPACVDRMDPVTSYVETGNLESVEVSRGNTDLSRSSRPGGTMNLVTSRPGFDRSWFGDASIDYNHNARTQKYSLQQGYSDDTQAVQAAISYRQADDFHAGGGEEISLSGYDKWNVKLDADRRFGHNQTGRFSYIGDLATDIGYPGLIMDTREAKSHLFSYEHEWEQPLEGVSSLMIKPYHTRVDHYMDDYDRDVTTRDVMPDMYMPMYGNTRTTGIRADAALYRGDHLLEAGLHLHRLDAFADMLMEPVDEEESEMYLYNIGDARQYTSYLALDYSYPLSPNFTLNASGALELSDRDLHNQTAANVLKSEHNGISVSNTWTGLSGSVALSYNHQDRYLATLTLSDAERLPSHLEHYGYYIYNPVDDFFYHGNPELQPERSSQAELNIIRQTRDRNFGVETSLFFNYMTNYIDGRPVPGSDTFQHYVNYDAALTAGGEISVFWQPSDQLEVTSGGAWVYAENLETGEPLPMMPPLEGFAQLGWQSDRVGLDTRVRAAATQNRIADQTTRETPTDGFILTDITGRFSITDGIELQAGVNNLFDVKYYEHTSPGDMPSPGRDVFVRVGYSW